MVAQYSVSMPEGILPYVNEEETHIVFDQRALLIYPYIKNDVISYGKAAEILGVKKRELIDLYARYDIPYLLYDMSEVDEEVAQYRRVKERTL